MDSRGASSADSDAASLHVLELSGQNGTRAAINGHRFRSSEFSFRLFRSRFHRAHDSALVRRAAGNYTGVSSHLIVAIEKLRAERNLPRFVYIRPTEQALRRSGAEGRDKDTKPVFVDLESYLFLEIFHRWLMKAGEIEVTEMLPSPEHLLWKEPDGRHSFELRTLIVPRS